MANKYTAARQVRRGRRMIATARNYLGRVVRDIERESRWAKGGRAKALTHDARKFSRNASPGSARRSSAACR